MGDIVSLPVRHRPHPAEIVRSAGASDIEVAAAIFQMHHRLVAEALENIAAANLELNALNRMAVSESTDRVGDLINDEIVISISNALVHLIGARGNLPGEQPIRIALLQMIAAMEGRANG